MACSYHHLSCEQCNIQEEAASLEGKQRLDRDVYSIEGVAENSDDLIKKFFPSVLGVSFMGRHKMKQMIYRCYRVVPDAGMKLLPDFNDFHDEISNS